MSPFRFILNVPLLKISPSAVMANPASPTSSGIPARTPADIDDDQSCPLSFNILPSSDCFRETSEPSSPRDVLNEPNATKSVVKPENFPL